MKILAFFQLIRWKNLLIIFLMQLLVSGILLPTFELADPFLHLNFWLISMSTICIAASGYIINDIYDIPIDLINKKGKTIVSKIISIKTAKFLYILTTIVGLLLGIFASININKPPFILIFILLSFLLFLYSYTFKSTPLLGNIIIAFLVSSSLLIIGIFELANISYHSLTILFTYSLFAFITNLLREIIKDIEDIEGDICLGLNTLPILIGRQRTNNIVLIVCIAFTIAIVMVLFKVNELEILTRIYGSLFIVLPTVYFISKLYTSKTKKDYTKLSSLLKIIMLLGIGSIFTL